MRKAASLHGPPQIVVKTTLRLVFWVSRLFTRDEHATSSPTALTSRRFQRKKPRPRNSVDTERQAVGRVRVNLADRAHVASAGPGAETPYAKEAK